MFYRSIATAEEWGEGSITSGAVSGYSTDFDPAFLNDLSVLEYFGNGLCGGEQEETSEQELTAENVISDALKPAIFTQGQAIEELLKLTCGERGFHRWKIPTPGDGLANAECKDCTLTILLKSLRLRHRAEVPAKVAQSRSVQASATTHHKAKRSIKFNLLLDALSFKGDGSWANLETLVSDQLDEFWKLHSIIRDLEWLGHIDVELEKGSGRLKRWSVSSPTLSYLGDEQAVLTGFRSVRLVRELERLTTESGGTFIRFTPGSQPNLYTIDGISPVRARELFGELKDPHQRQIKIVDRAPERLAVACGELGGLFATLVPVSTGAPNSPQRYDIDSGKWRNVEGIYDEGAYRYQYNGVVYAYRSPEGRTLRGPHQLIKLLYARKRQAELHSYEPSTRTFTSRMGCEPIGLLGRALVASSGRLPEKAPGGLSAFSNVSPEVAAKVLEIMYLGELPS